MLVGITIFNMLVQKSLKITNMGKEEGRDYIRLTRA